MQEKFLNLIININYVGSRLDRFLKDHYNELTHSLIEKNIRKKLIKVSNKVTKSNYILKEGDIVNIYQKFIDNISKEGKENSGNDYIDHKFLQLIKGAIIYEDDNILAFNKPSGIAVQGGTNIKHSIDHALKYLNLRKKDELKLVHRIDKDTSGLLLVARNKIIARQLAQQFNHKTIKKVYWAVVHGKPKYNEDVINRPLLKKSFGNNIDKIIEDPYGDEAITCYKLIDFNQEFSLLELIPITGRTHQLRVHCKLIGCPILGDNKYGKEINQNIKNIEKKLHLHAKQIYINNLISDKELVLQAPLPEYVKNTIELLGFNT